MNIRIIILSLAICGSVALSMAQPAARRTQQPAAAQQTTTAKASVGRDFPVAQDMPSDAAWRRDIYRSLDLNKDANATLYYPTTPQGDRMNLFTYLFKLILRGQVKAYEYTLDGNEHFDAAHQVKARKIMDTYEIYYEEVTTADGKKTIKVNDADLPSEDVKLYFIKESSYYDQHTASFRTKVTAICPVLQRGDSDFGGAELRNPMFWVNYEEAAPFLSKLQLMGSNLNNAASISADDYFTLNRYQGEIYKATNLQDRILANYCPTDSLMKKEQQRIEQELTDFRQHVWGHDSIAQAEADPGLVATTPASESAQTPGKEELTPATTTRTAAAAQKRARTTTTTSTSSRTRTTTAGKAKTPSAAKPKASKPRTTATSGTMSVRKQRH